MCRRPNRFAARKAHHKMRFRVAAVDSLPWGHRRSANTRNAGPGRLWSIAAPVLTARGIQRFSFGEGPDGGGFQMAEPRGTTRFSFGEGGDGGGFEIAGPEGAKRFSLGYGLDGGAFQMLDPVGNTRFEVGHTDTDGAMKISDGAGNKRFEVFDGGEWLGRAFLDVDAMERARIRMGPDGQSDLFVTGGVTEWAASACQQ